MHPLRHIGHSLILLVLAGASFSLIKNVVDSDWVLVKPEEEPYGFCGTESIELKHKGYSNKTGKSLFQANCATCHAFNKDLAGPALLDFHTRGPWKDRKELYKWIHNPTAYIKKNKYTQELLVQYGAAMQGFPNLTHAQIDSIADYLGAPPAVAKR